MSKRHITVPPASQKAINASKSAHSSPSEQKGEMGVEPGSCGDIHRVGGKAGAASHTSNESTFTPPDNDD